VVRLPVSTPSAADDATLEGSRRGIDCDSRRDVNVSPILRSGCGSAVGDEPHLQAWRPSAFAAGGVQRPAT